MAQNKYLKNSIRNLSKFWWMIVLSSIEVDKYVCTKLINSKCMIIYLYMDDILIFYTTYHIICETKKFLYNKWNKKFSYF